MSYFYNGSKSLRATPHRKQDQLADSIFTSLRVGRVRSNIGYGKLKVILEGPVSSPQAPNPNNETGNRSNEIECQMLLPYFSQKPAEAAGSDPNNFEDSQTASGSAFPAPQPGTFGLIALAEDNLNIGFWLGAFPEPGIGNNIPDFATREYVGGSESDLNELRSTVGLPAGEMVKASQDGSVAREKYKNPVHPFARVLQRQGLLVDTVRGQTSSSATREAPSRVLGFNTPGAPGTTTALNPDGDNTSVTNLGGHTFSMDDGDIRGRNNLVRIRSSKGGQFLIHDSEELIYIATQSGNAWIEMTKDGKVDIYAKDSVSIHSEADFNFRADRDVNLEGGRNVNIKAVEGFHLEGETTNFLAKNTMNLDVRGSLDIIATDTRLLVGNLSLQSENIDITNKLNLKAKSSNMDLQTFYGITASAGTGIELKTANAANQVWINNYNPAKTYNKGQSVIFANQFYRALSKAVAPGPAQTPIPPAPGPYWELIPPAIPTVPHTNFVIDTNPLGKFQVSSFSDIALTSVTGKIDVKATQNVHMDGAQIRMNEGLSGISDLAVIATPSTLLEPQPTTALGVIALRLWTNPTNDPEGDWATTTYLTTESTNSIMRRIPQHEPWTLHEGANRESTSKYATDREAE